MWFYDKECPVHNAMRARVPKEVDIRGILTVFYTPAFSGIVSDGSEVGISE
jgi:hypothetical protein